jgi:hypothetical protein
MLAALETARSEIDLALVDVAESDADGVRAPAAGWSADEDASDRGTIAGEVPAAALAIEELYTPHVPPPPVDPHAVYEPTRRIELPEGQPPGEDTEETVLPEQVEARRAAERWLLREMDLDITAPQAFFEQAGGASELDDTPRAAAVPDLPVVERTATVQDLPSDEDATTKPLPVAIRAPAAAPAPALPLVPAPTPISPPATTGARGPEQPPGPPPRTVVISAGAPRGQLVTIVVVAAVAFVAGVLATIIVVALLGAR